MFSKMEDIKLEYQVAYDIKDLIPLQKIDLKKIIVVKENFGVFSIRCIIKKEEKPLKMKLKCACSTVNWGLNDEIFLRLEDELKIEKILHVIRKKNEIEGKDIMFVGYNKIKIKLLNDRKIKLRIRKYFADGYICFRKTIMKSKDVYFIHTNFDNGKILSI